MQQESKIKVFEAFAGYGSQSMALKRAGVDFEVVGISEFDKYATCAYMAVHGETKNFGDITLINEKELPDFNLFTYSFPCTDISVSGKLAGMIGTRSGLLWECERIISHKLPKYLLMENVKNLVGKKFKPDFEKWCKFLEDLGYENHWQVLNAKEHGIPQNRERVFMVSILGGGEYQFPEKEELSIFLKDVLEEEVDEKYYLRPEQYSNMLKNLKNKTISNTIRCGGRGSVDRHSWDLVALNTNPSGRGMNGAVCTNDISPTLTTNKGEGLKILVKEATKKGYKEANIGDSINLEQPNSKTRRGRVGNQVAQTLTTGSHQAVVENIHNFRVRKLTPLECFRLMDVSDEDFFKIQKSLNETFYKGKNRSSSQLYKLAGNSIVVKPLMKIFENLHLQSRILSPNEQ